MKRAGAGESGGIDAARGGDLRDPSRLRALDRTGLTAEPDPRMDEFAAWVRTALAVPVALVSLVRADEQQVLPGVSGLPEPWVSKRSGPLTYAFCRHVVRTARPLVITDARTHPLAQDGRAVPDRGVVAYAAMPLVDDAGNVLGSLCAIDHEPRTFTGADIDTLRNIARACSTELQLRLARCDADRVGDRRDDVERAQRRASDRSRTLLLASEAFTRTTTVADVRARIDEMAGTELRAAYVDIVMLDERRRLRSLDAPVDQGGDSASPSFGLGTVLPSTTAVRERRIVHYPDRTSFDRDHPAAARERIRALGLHSVVAVPVQDAEGPVGAIVLGWDVPNAIEPEDLPTIATIAGYTGHALSRARFLQHRTSAAHEMQSAMLTTLPVVPGLLMAARYAPADSREYVGGDWYDAAPVLDPGRAGDQVLGVSVGDIIGHNLHAATIMGQVRSMLRQSAWDHPGGPPSEILGAFETANLGLGLAASGTAIVAHLRRVPGDRWSLMWTNAGHPPPILLHPGGTTELLGDHDALFGFDLPPEWTRTDHHRELAPGTTLFLYTDGLVERRGSDLDAGTDSLLTLLHTVRDRTPEEIVDTAVYTLAPDAADDVVAFAIRIPEGA